MESDFSFPPTKKFDKAKIYSQLQYMTWLQKWLFELYCNTNPIEWNYKQINVNTTCILL